MSDEHERRLQQLLEQLGRAIHTSVADSDDVVQVLAQLRGGGWEAVMLLEAFVASRSNGDGDRPTDTLRVRVDISDPVAEYRLDAADARWLSALGISPTRHRSHPQRPLPSSSRTMLPAPDSSRHGEGRS